MLPLSCFCTQLNVVHDYLSQLLTTKDKTEEETWPKWQSKKIGEAALVTSLNH